MAAVHCSIYQRSGNWEANRGFDDHCCHSASFLVCCVVWCGHLHTGNTMYSLIMPEIVVLVSRHSANFFFLNAKNIALLFFTKHFFPLSFILASHMSPIAVISPNPPATRADSVASSLPDFNIPLIVLLFE